MNSEQPGLLLSTPPFLRKGESTPWIMRQVVFALVPVLAAAWYYFGLSAVLVTGAAVAGCLGTEWLFDTHRPRGRTIKDGSGLVTGLLLGLVLPPGLPLWMACLGGVVSIGMGKIIWGGLGQNLFNPALLGRAFLQAAFPTAITTWSPQGTGFFSMHGTNLAPPFFKSTAVDALSSATPLARMKFQAQSTDIFHLALGDTAGSLGETCGMIILLAGIYLAARRIFDWRIPMSILLTTLALSSVFYLVDAARYPSPLFMLFSGGLLLGAVFMATDPVSSPITPLGSWIFGIGVGCLVVLIRLFGGMPEGVMYAILLMNAVTPLINRVTQPRVYGT
jgi:H+/Na+-translocating ferredoxin:NAD+ oxidoreductase subunit D